MPRELRWKMFHYTRLSPFTVLRVRNRVTDHKTAPHSEPRICRKFPRPLDCCFRFVSTTPI